MKRFVFLGLFLALLCAICNAQDTKTVDYWMKTWPNLIKVSFPPVTVLIPKELLVSEYRSGLLPEEANSKLKFVYGKVKISKDSRVFDLWTEGGPKRDAGIAIQWENYKYIGAQVLCCIPGNGSVYTFQYFGNSMVSKKYNFIEGDLVEAKQPLYNLSLETITSVDLVLYSDEAQTVVLANVPKGSKVLVLGSSTSKEDLFLIRSEGGLVGWHQLAPGPKSKSSMAMTFSLPVFDHASD